MPAEYGAHALLIPTGTERALGVKAFRDFVTSLDPVLDKALESVEVPEQVSEVLVGTLAQRPEAAAGGTRLYVVVGDTAERNGQAFVDAGESWQQIAGTGATSTPGAGSAALEPRKVLTYDGAGNLATITVTDASGATTISTSTLTYEGGNLTRVVTYTGSGASARTRTRTLTYDAAGNLTLVTESEVAS